MLDESKAVATVEQSAGNRWLTRKDRDPALADAYESCTGAVTQLLARHPEIEGVLLDPCCGRGVIVRELRRLRPNSVVYGGDLRDIPMPAGCYPKTDGFSLMEAFSANPMTKPDWIVVNPPFNCAERFTLAALANATVGVAVFQRCQWTEGKTRHTNLWGQGKASAQHIFSARYDCFPEGQVTFDTGMMSFSWFIFRNDYHGPMLTDWISEPCSWEFDTRWIDVPYLTDLIARTAALASIEPDKKKASTLKAKVRKMQKGLDAYLLRYPNGWTAD